MKGVSRGTILITTWSASRNTTSIGKRMNAVWIDHAGRSRMPWPDGRSRFPSSPRSRRIVESATMTDSATTRPSSRRSVRFGTGRTRLAGSEMSPIVITTGTSRIMKSDGMIRKAIGKSIFTGAFCARSSA